MEVELLVPESNTESNIEYWASFYVKNARLEYNIDWPNENAEKDGTKHRTLNLMDDPNLFPVLFNT